MKPEHYREIDPDCCRCCEYSKYVQYNDPDFTCVICMKHRFEMTPYAAEGKVCDDFEDVQ